MSENLLSLSDKVRTSEDAVKYLQDKGILKTKTECSKCKEELKKITKKANNYYFFRCNKCESTESIRKDTFLYNKVRLLPLFVCP